MRALAVVLLCLPLALMLTGLAAAWVPVPWQDWLVLQLLLGTLLWMGLSLLAAMVEKTWPVLVGLLLANGAAWLALQGTGLYGGAA
ncbi:hypothetical protein [Alcanivorax sp.]|jgi:hypothetical protein|uniref:hypothetical protein n=1 Tax=Alcanivorax sp. TaxID=1872427 RepID=UPI002437E9A2|nr:hypothetical protein [Alcanivorax sp.]